MQNVHYNFYVSFHSMRKKAHFNQQLKTALLGSHLVHEQKTIFGAKKI